LFGALRFERDLRMLFSGFAGGGGAKIADRFGRYGAAQILWEIPQPPKCSAAVYDELEERCRGEIIRCVFLSVGLESLVSDLLGQFVIGFRQLSNM
jgi:hypothetical protein